MKMAKIKTASVTTIKFILALIGAAFALASLPGAWSVVQSHRHTDEF